VVKVGYAFTDEEGSGHCSVGAPDFSVSVELCDVVVRFSESWRKSGWREY
jgi:hypothetical protein